METITIINGQRFYSKSYLISKGFVKTAKQLLTLLANNMVETHFVGTFVMDNGKYELIGEKYYKIDK